MRRKALTGVHPPIQGMRSPTQPAFPRHMLRLNASLVSNFEMVGYGGWKIAACMSQWLVRLSCRNTRLCQQGGGRFCQSLVEARHICIPKHSLTVSIGGPVLIRHMYEYLDLLALVLSPSHSQPFFLSHFPCFHQPARKAVSQTDTEHHGST